MLSPRESGTNKMKTSTIEDHNVDQDTDKLYQPLRNAILNP